MACRGLLFGLLFIVAGVAWGQKPDEIRKSIYFGGGSYYIDADQEAALNAWLDSIPNLDTYSIHLISHTDPIGGRAFNEWLSGKRSGAVLDLLLERNIPREKISIRDWAYDNPLYSNSTFSGMQMNRRVDVILYPLLF